MIVRVFKATALAGKQQEFKTFFINEALPMIKSQNGLVDVYVGLPIKDSSQEFMMTTIWANIESLIEFAGDNWENPVIDEREKDLLLEASVDHYVKFE